MGGEPNAVDVAAHTRLPFTRPLSVCLCYTYVTPGGDRAWPPPPPPPPPSLCRTPLGPARGGQEG
eukprot:7034125-Pyramimonas_sp.AAC.1